MSWWALELRPEPSEREAVAEWLVSVTGNGIEERGGVLITVATDEAAADRLTQDIENRFSGRVGVSREELPEVDWASRWRDGLGPRRIGRLVVSPSWAIPDETVEGEVLVVLDPETAFGSGEHGSTRAALTLLERHLSPGDRVLDLGSGSGILAIAAIGLGAASAIGIEIDEDAIVVAERNAERNGAASARFIAGDAATLAPVAGPVNLLLSNILRTVNETLLDSIRASLLPGGIAIFSGMEQEESSRFRHALERAGYLEIDEVIDGSWWAVAARTR